MAFEGILTVNKPANITSYDVIRSIKNIIGKQKVGHAGTLDPIATGILPIALGNGTKTIQFLQLLYQFFLNLFLNKIILFHLKI